MSPRCAGLVLAAGRGARFGSEPKLLSLLSGRPILEHSVAAACAVQELERVVVVLGWQADALKSQVDFGRAELVICPDWEEGVAASLRCGVDSLPGADKVIVTLGDMPFVTPQLIARFVHESPRTRALFRGAPGHPVVLGPDELGAVEGLRGDTGARNLLLGGIGIECGWISGLDIDTREDLTLARCREQVFGSVETNLAAQRPG